MKREQSRSSLALPAMAEASGPDASNRGAPSSEALAVRVLVVEDDPVSQRVARRYLEGMGCVAVVTDNGAEAVKTCLQGEFALILMDLQMPRMDGLQATREIRRQERRSRVPIFGLTANAGSDELPRCTAAGMDGLLVKPLQRHLLSQVLERLALAHPEPVPPESDIHPDVAPAEALPADLAALRARFEGDTVFVQRLCHAFLTSTCQLLDELERAAQAGNRAQLRALAHRIKGASNNVHAYRTAMLATRIEAESSSMSSSELSQAIDALGEAVDEVALHVSAELQ